ncbi:hypothetical protein AAVH_40907, partial [Aphelenchoides avenae]
DLSSWPILDDADGALSDFGRLVKAVTRHYESWPFFVITSGIDDEQNSSTLISIDNPQPHFIDLVRKNSTAYKLELSLFAKRWAQATGKSIDNGVLAREVEQVARLEEDIADILQLTAETVTNSLDTNNKFKLVRPTSKFTGTPTEICVDLTSLVMPEAVDSLYFDLILPQDDSDDLLVDAIFGD